MEFIKPERFNGATFQKECDLAGISIISFFDNGEGVLIVEADSKTEKKIVDILANHDGSDTSPTTLEKLELAGIDIDELRAALGL
jgi:hypothetical protein